VNANEATAHRLRLRKEQFDQAADRAFGDQATDGEVAERLGLDPSSLSLYRNGHRQPPRTLITKLLATFPDLEFEDLFEVVPETERAAR
jgi:transcriptional regulator with XRE-family HTH domain